MQTINTLNFTQHIILYGTDTSDFQNVMRIHTTFGQFISSFQLLPLQHFNTRTVRYQIRLTLSGFVVCNDYFPLFLCLTKLYFSSKFGNNSKTFRLSCLEQLLDTGKTLCYIITSNTTGMECTHGKLCTRLTNRLGGNNTNCLSYLYRFFCRHVRTITFCTNTYMRLAGQNRTNFNLCFISCVNNCFCIHNAGGALRRNHMIRFHDNIPIVIFYRLTGITSGNTLFQRLNHFASIHESAYPHTRNLVGFAVRTAISLTDNQFLRNIYQSSCQIS